MIRKVLFAALLAAFFSGCCIPGGACIGKDRLAERRRVAAESEVTKAEDFKANWEQKLVEAEEYCLERTNERVYTGEKNVNGHPLYENGYYMADKTYRYMLTKLDWTPPPAVRYSLFKCRMHGGDFRGAARVAEKMMKLHPELVKPKFLALNAYMYDKTWMGYIPYEEVQQSLADLQDQYPGQEPVLVKEIQRLIGEHLAWLAELQRLEEEDRARMTDLSDYETLEKFGGNVGQGEVNESIEYWEELGYTNVTWVPLRDDLGQYYSEIWGKSAK